MNIEQWWPNLRPSTREWLIANNGDELPADVRAEVTHAGGTIADGIRLSDEETDWIEATANDE